MSQPSRRALLAGSLGASAFAPLLLGEHPAAADITVPDVSGVFFLKLDTIPGESTDNAHPGQIDVLDWTFGVTTSISPTNTGSGVSKSKPQDFVFVHRYDKASPLLFLAACTGKHLSQAVLSVRRSGATVDYLTLTLSNVFVTSVVDALETGSGLPLEQVHLDFGAIKLTYRVQNAEGGVTSTITEQFNFLTNKAS